MRKSLKLSDVIGNSAFLPQFSSWKDVAFDSHEEIFFLLWLLELKEQGNILDFKYHENRWKLVDRQAIFIPKPMKTKTGFKPKTWSQEVSYEADFVIFWNPVSIPSWVHPFKREKIGTFPELKEEAVMFFNENTTKGSIYSVVDVKGSFYKRSSDSYVFAIKKAIMLERYGILVNKVIPHSNDGKCLFARTFVPKIFMKTKTGKDRKINYRVKNVEKMKTWSKDFTNDLFLL